MTWATSPKVYGVALGGVFLTVLFLNALVSEWARRAPGPAARNRAVLEVGQHE